MRLLFLLCLSCSFLYVFAQPIKVKNVGVAYRQFNLTDFGGNPLSFGLILKNSASLNNINSSFDHNGLTSGYSGGAFRNYALTAELGKRDATERFWKKYNIQTGAFVSNQMRSTGMSLIRQKWLDQDSSLRTQAHVFDRVSRFVGGFAGVNRKFRISHGFWFIAGLQLQGSATIQHYFSHSYDSTFTNGRVYKRFSQQLAPMPARSFWQWQPMLPVGFELAFPKQKLQVRGELIVGYVRSKFHTTYRGRSLWACEAHGVGVGLQYLL